MRSDKERRDAAAATRRPGNPFAILDPDRPTYELYKIDKSGGVTWIKVPV